MITCHKHIIVFVRVSYANWIIVIYNWLFCCKFEKFVRFLLATEPRGSEQILSMMVFSQAELVHRENFDSFAHACSKVLLNWLEFYWHLLNMASWKWIFERLMHNECRLMHIYIVMSLVIQVYSIFESELVLKKARFAHKKWRGYWKIEPSSKFRMKSLQLMIQLFNKVPLEGVCIFCIFYCIVFSA